MRCKCGKVIHNTFSDVKCSQTMQRKKQFRILRTYKCKYGKYHLSKDNRKQISFLLENEERIIEQQYNKLFKKGTNYV